MKDKTYQIIRLGNVSTNNSQGGAVYSIVGVSQTICAGPHGYGTGNIAYYETDERDEQNNSSW